MTARMEGPGGGAHISAGSAHLSAVACLMMLERVNYLLSSGVQLPKAEMIDRLTAIIFAAFQAAPASQDEAGQPR
jgi:hypothetical protein